MKIHQRKIQEDFVILNSPMIKDLFFFQIRFYKIKKSVPTSFPKALSKQEGTSNANFFSSSESSLWLLAVPGPLLATFLFELLLLSLMSSFLELGLSKTYFQLQQVLYDYDVVDMYFQLKWQKDQTDVLKLCFGSAQFLQSTILKLDLMRKVLRCLIHIFLQQHNFSSQIISKVLNLYTFFYKTCINIVVTITIYKHSLCHDQDSSTDLLCVSCSI